MEPLELRGAVASPQIMKPAEGVILAGVWYPFPSGREIARANHATQHQLRLFTQFQKITSTTEEGEGMKFSLMRRVRKLEEAKHPLLRTEFVHLLPDRIRKLVDVPFA